MRKYLMLAHVPILLCWIILAVIGYGQLPDRIPTHFDASGTPDGFMQRSYVSWFLLPLVALISALTIFLTTVWAERNPRLWNVPNKARFLALSPEQQRPLIDTLNTLLSTVSLSTVLFLAALHYDTWRVARGTAPGLSALSMTAFAFLLVFGVGGAIFSMVRFNQQVKQLTR